jgi:hypothetical protein
LCDDRFLDLGWSSSTRLMVKVRDESLVRNKAADIALGVRADRADEILGLWLEQNEDAKFWLRVINELRNRGVEDVGDGLKGDPGLLPEATVQTCIFHLLRHGLDFVLVLNRCQKEWKIPPRSGAWPKPSSRPLWECFTKAMAE